MHALCEGNFCLTLVCTGYVRGQGYPVIREKLHWDSQRYFRCTSTHHKKRLGETSPKYRDPGSCHTTRINFYEKFFLDLKRGRKGAMEKGTEDTSNLVQIEELKCVIEKLPFVTALSPVRAVKGKERGYGVTLRCPSCEEYGSCGKKQEPPVQVSNVHPTELVCLQELLKRL